jgi:hypothetical protein
LRDEAASNAALESKLALLDYEREQQRALVAFLKEQLASKQKDQETVCGHETWFLRRCVIRDFGHPSL